MIVVIVFLVHVVSSYGTEYIVPPSTIPEALYPDWAHTHWVWLSSDEGNQTNDLELVKDYMRYDIPVTITYIQHYVLK